MEDKSKSYVKYLKKLRSCSFGLSELYKCCGHNITLVIRNLSQKIWKTKDRNWSKEKKKSNVWLWMTRSVHLASFCTSLPLSWSGHKCIFLQFRHSFLLPNKVDRIKNLRVNWFEIELIYFTTSVHAERKAVKLMLAFSYEIFMSLSPWRHRTITGPLLLNGAV